MSSVTLNEAKVEYEKIKTRSGPNARTYCQDRRRRVSAKRNQGDRTCRIDVGRRVDPRRILPPFRFEGPTDRRSKRRRVGCACGRDGLCHSQNTQTKGTWSARSKLPIRFTSG